MGHIRDRVVAEADEDTSFASRPSFFFFLSTFFKEHREGVIQQDGLLTIPGRSKRERKKKVHVEDSIDEGYCCCCCCWRGECVWSVYIYDMNTRRRADGQTPAIVSVSFNVFSAFICWICPCLLQLSWNDGGFVWKRVLLDSRTYCIYRPHVF